MKTDVEISGGVMGQFNEAIAYAHIGELQRQNRAMAAQIGEMRAFIRQFPAKIAQARLDVRDGKSTSYDYARAAHVCRVEVA